MANEAIPAVSAELLAAQSQSGQAGVKAYQDAQAALQTQKQQAVQVAMQEAALRGSPAGAIQSQTQTMTQPYDTRIASLAQGQAGFQADMAARDARYGAYQNAVGQARTLIPGEVEKIVAPIRAQGEATIANTTRQGQNAVDQINAQNALALTRMQAAVQASQIAAAKAAASSKAAASKLTGTDLQAMLSQGTAAKMQGSLGNLGKLLAENEAKWGKDSEPVKAIDTAKTNYQTARDEANAKGPPQDPSTLSGPYSPAQMTAMKAKYQQDLAEWYRTQGAGSQGAVPQNPATLIGPYSPAQMAKMQAEYKAALAAQQPPNPATVMGPYSPAQLAQMKAKYEASSTVPQNPATIVGPYSAAQKAAMQSKYTAALGAVQPAAEQAAQLARARAKQAAQPAYDAMMQAGQAGMDVMHQNQTQYGNISSAQLQALAASDPYLAGLITNAPAPLSTVNMGKYLAGEPDSLGQVDPYSLQAVRAAQETVAGDLTNQGYSITPQDFQNAVGTDMKPGESFAQYAARATGQLSAQDQAKAVADQKKAVRDDITWQHTQQQWLRDQGKNDLADAKTQMEWSYYMNTHNSDGSPKTDPDTGLPVTATPAEQQSATTKQYDQQATASLAQWGVPLPSSATGSPSDIAGVVYAGSTGIDESTGAPDGPFFKAQAALEASQSGLFGNLQSFNKAMADPAIANLGLTAGQKALLRQIWYKPPSPVNPPSGG